MKLSRAIVVLITVAVLFSAIGCASSTPTPTLTPTPTSTPSPTPSPTATTPPPPTSIRLGVFIPGRLGDSPPYDALANGAQKAALRDKRLTVEVFEAGFDQSKWQEQLTSFAASGKYDVIYASNEALGPLVVKTAATVPNVKFLVNDSYVTGNDRIFTAFFNKYQQGYLYGYMMALVSTSTLPGANPDKKLGLIYGQHYTMMDDLIIPGIEAGAKAVDPAFELKTAMLGNWYDAKKAESLASSLIDEGVDCLGAIAGSGNAGVVNAAKTRGVYMVWFDVAGFDKAPGTVIGTVGSSNEDLVTLELKNLLDGTITWGKPLIVGAEQGYISVPLLAPGYVNYMPADAQKKFAEVYNKVVSGTLPLPVPQAILDKLDKAAKGS
ncbi:MAG: BMP family ABC transporter substrate-binding protein [Coprothermobacterota bacterium]|nr:BMP family ABC transporter substrate-binding protein [Coprothermobacterota bacterium]